MPIKITDQTSKTGTLNHRETGSVSIILIPSLKEDYWERDPRGVGRIDAWRDKKLKGELSSVRAEKSSEVPMWSSYWVVVPRPRESKGTRDSKKVDNLHWRVEKYFLMTGIEGDALKVSTTSIYLNDVVSGGTRIFILGDKLKLEVICNIDLNI